MKRALLLILVLMLLVPCGHASRLLKNMLLQFEDMSDENFDIMCDYREDGCVACMQMIYKQTYIDTFKKFQLPDSDFKSTFYEIIANAADSFHNIATSTGECNTSVVTVVSSDNCPFALYVNGQNLDWMNTNWDGFRPFEIR